MRGWVTGVVAASLLLWLPASADASRRCESFSYRHRTAHVTYAFSQLRISGAPCSTIRRVVVGFFHGNGRRHGPLPTDGYDVDGWNVLLHTSSLDGRRRGAFFVGVYV